MTKRGQATFLGSRKISHPSKINRSEKLPVPFSLPALVLGAVTDLETISARILEKNGVVTGFPGLGNFMSGSFDVPRSRTSSNLSQPINLADAVSPESDAAFVRTVLGRLGNAEKLRDAIHAGRLKLQPPLDRGVASEAERGQEHLVEPSCLGKAAHSEINVIVASVHSENGLSSENEAESI